MFQNLLGDVFHDRSSMLLGLMIFLAAATLAFSLMVAVRVRGSVKRRAARIIDPAELPTKPKRSLRYSSQQAVQRLIAYTTRHYAAGGEESMKILRRRLVQAGIYDPRGVALFFLVRTGLALVFAAVLFFVFPMVTQTSKSILLLAMLMGGIFGYVAPSMYVDRLVKKRQAEHRIGFPDFMDLLVVCADSGLSMEAALERIGREIGDSYPSLTSNIQMANLEIRAGRGLSEALEHFADRLALDEARSFATLVNQSIALGSSITDALRVYSDDMRHKRMSRAEEKAFALPAKLALPMMICIFPVLFVVILLPVYIRIHTGSF